MNLLEINSINVSRGAAQILWDVSIRVKEKELVCLVGPNGAGKSTLMETILGLLRPSSGSIKFMGTEITDLPTYSIVNQGISLVPEGRRVFPKMTTIENLYLGAYTPRSRKRMKENLERVFQLFPILKERRRQTASTLSGGEQQMLVIGRALMSSPELLMFDEPSLGLAPKIVKEVLNVVNEVNKKAGITVLLVEQNVYDSLKIAERAYVLETGRIALEGKGAELLENPHIKEAYLGLL